MSANGFVERRGDFTFIAASNLGFMKQRCLSASVARCSSCSQSSTFSIVVLRRALSFSQAFRDWSVFFHIQKRELTWI